VTYTYPRVGAYSVEPTVDGLAFYLFVRWITRTIDGQQDYYRGTLIMDSSEVVPAMIAQQQALAGELGSKPDDSVQPPNAMSQLSWP
jgi:hypothetical protein